MDIIPSLTLQTVRDEAWRSVSHYEYDEKGAVIGRNPNYEEEVERCQGHSYFTVRAEAYVPRRSGLSEVRVLEHIRIQSSWFKDSEPLQEREVLRKTLHYACDSFIKQILPNEAAQRTIPATLDTQNPHGLKPAYHPNAGDPGVSAGKGEVPRGDATSPGGESVRPGPKDTDDDCGVVGERYPER